MGLPCSAPPLPVGGALEQLKFSFLQLITTFSPVASSEFEFEIWRMWSESKCLCACTRWEWKKALYPNGTTMSKPTQMSAELETEREKKYTQRNSNSVAVPCRQILPNLLCWCSRALNVSGGGSGISDRCCVEYLSVRKLKLSEAANSFFIPCFSHK